MMKSYWKIIVILVVLALAIPLLNHATNVPDEIQRTIIAVNDGEVIYKDKTGMIGVYRDYNHSCNTDTWNRLLAIEQFPVKVTLYSSNNDKFDKVMVTREGSGE